MRPGAVPVVQNFRLFQQSTLACLEDQPSGTFAGTSKYGSVCWVAKGAHLEVLDMATLNRRAAWQFGRVLGDQHTTITGVEEIRVKKDSSLKLLVGISNSSPNGLLCLFDLNTTMIEKTIEIPYPVTAIEIVSTSMGDSIPRWALSEHLTYFCGIVAVGCSSGHTFLVDLRLDDKQVTSSEEQPSTLQFISPRNRDVENQRLQCLMKGQHLCIAVNETLFTTYGFEYQKPDGVVMKTFRPEQVTVTCLTYIPQTGILAIGYSFGCYQLWKLQVPVLEYSSRLETDPMPVTHIVHQEPENDPKNCCYLWVARSQLDPEEEYSNTVASISMYQFSFGRKAHYNSYGVFYDELTSICLRLDHELGSQPIQHGSNYEGKSRVLACYTLGSPYYQPPTRLTEDSFDESNHGPDLSLCVFVWEATEGTKTGHHVAIFDINRWYHAQMPATVRYASSTVETCSYMCFYKLNETQGLDEENLLTAYIDPDRIQKFHSNTLLPPEQHFYPSSLGFDATLIYDSGSAKVTYLGDQGQVLSNFKKKGPLVVVQPQEMYNMCIYVGLLARPIELVSTFNNASYQRDRLLSLALDYDILSLFKACVTDWASGEYLQQGCSLKYLLDWAWQTVSTIKHQIDTTCVNLYNWSGLILDQRSNKTLHQCEQKLIHLVSVFKMFTSQAIPITEQGEFEIQSKIFVSSLLSQHLSVILWFVHVGLLPENDDTEVMTGFRYAFPVTNLVSAYKARRKELQKLNSDTGLLMIDGLVEASEGVIDLWEREGGDRIYPPPSLHALLSTYLLEDVDMTTKHSLSLYLLLDLVSMETPEDNVTFSDKIVGFTQRYNLSSTLVKQVQAYWLLDHKDFEEAMSLLETSNMTSDFMHWQHRCILKALYYQGEVRLALRYLYIAKPPLFTLDDIKLKMSVLMANGFVSEALAYHRKTSTKANSKDLLTHVFYGCQQTKTVDRLLGQLYTNEEKMLEEYLENSDPMNMDLLVMHYLQSSRIVEAFQLNEKLKQYTVTESNSKARDRAAARNAIVDKYISIYPDIQRQLLFEQIHIPKRNTQLRRVVQRPTPLSTSVTRSKAPVMTQSSYIMKIMDSIRDIEPEELSPDKTLNQSVGPFLCTPVVPTRKSFIQTPTSILIDTDRTENLRTPKSTDKRRSYFSASCLMVLQTPKVKKVTPEKQRKLSINTVTPQSILKVRNLVNITSPSPHSGGSTPNSQETGTSGKKKPRKLGYSSQSGTPKSVGLADQSLAGIPRHLRMEVQGSSQPTTPKSVSFVEPSTPTESPQVQTPKQGTSSQTGTPKSVRFSEKKILSASQLQILVTPKRVDQKKEGQKSPPAPISPSKKLSPPKSPRSVKERSPTPQSSERSPRFAEHLDHLCRRSIHDHSPTDIQHDENLVLRMEQSDENISDEDMETEESSPKQEAEESNLDASVTSGESVILVTRHSPITSPKQASPIDSPKTSPKQASTGRSPKMSPKQAPAGQSPNTSPKVTQKQSLSPKKSSIDIYEKSIDLEPKSSSSKSEKNNSEQFEMEVEEAGIVVTSSKEIFSQEEEISAALASEIEDKTDAVTSSGDIDKDSENVVVKQEVENEFYDPPKLVRQLTPPSSMIEEKSPTKTEIKHSPPSSGLDVSTSSPVMEEMMSVQDEYFKDAEKFFADSPDLEEEKRAPIPASSRFKMKPLVKGTYNFDDNIFDEMSSEAIKVEIESDEEKVKSPVTPTRSLRHKQVESGTEEPMTPTRSSRRLSMRHVAGASTPSRLGETEAPVTPTRSSRRVSMRSAAGPSTPSRLEEIEAPLTPTRSSRRLSTRLATGSSTPTRSQKKASKGAKMEVITALSPKPFSSKAKEAVQESLIALSAELATVHETSPDEMTKIRDKPESAQSPLQTPTRSTRRSTTPNMNVDAEIVDKSKPSQSPSRTPTRTTRRSTTPNLNVDAEILDKSKPSQSPSRTPTRTTRRSTTPNIIVDAVTVDKAKPSTTSKGRNENVDTVDTELQNTPARSRKNDDTVKEAKSPAREKKSTARDKNSNNSETIKTPMRRQKKDTEEIITEIVCEKTQSVPLTPTRRSKRSIEKSENVLNEIDIGHSEIPMDLPEEEPTTPSRRSSLSRSCKATVEEVAPVTPTRRQSLGRSTKKAAVHKSPEKELVQKGIESPEITKTPTRRGRSKKSDLIDKRDKSNSDGEYIGTTKSPSRLHKTKQITDETDKSPQKVKEGADMSKPEGQKTPTRRGRTTRNSEKVNEKSPLKAAKMSDDSETETKKTPSRRGRSKKDIAHDTEDVKAVEAKTPTRRGKSKDKKDEGSDMESKAKVTPSRRKKAKRETEENVTSASNEHNELPKDPEVFDIQSVSFQFSNPMEVDNTEASEPPKSFTPVKSFIFSPPIQHARSRIESQKLESKIVSGATEQDTDEDVDVKDEVVKEKAETKRETRKNTRLKTLYKEEAMVKEQIILLQEDSDVNEDGLAVMTRTARTTRSKDKKKDGTKAVLQSILPGRRPRKTVFRAGPIVRKK